MHHGIVPSLKLNMGSVTSVHSYSRLFVYQDFCMLPYMVGVGLNILQDKVLCYYKATLSYIASYIDSVMCVAMSLCMYVCVRAVCTCVCTCVHVHICMCMCICIMCCMHVYLCEQVYMCACVCILNALQFCSYTLV